MTWHSSCIVFEFEIQPSNFQKLTAVKRKINAFYQQTACSPLQTPKKDKTTFILTTLAELAVESFFEQTSSYSYFRIFCCSLPTDRSKKIFISHDRSPCEKPLQGDICMLTVSGRLILPGCQTKGEKGSEGKILLLTSQSLLCYSHWHVICCHPEMSHSNPSVKALTVETLKSWGF